MNQLFLKNLLYGYKRFIDNDLNSRGSEKEEIQHDFIGCILKKLIPERFEVIAKSEDVNSTYGEYTLPILGDKEKHMDITILDKKLNKPVLCINCKFPLASYNKNNPNYKSDVCGEALRLRLSDANPGLPLFMFNIMMSNIPVFGKGKSISRFDKIDNVIDTYDVIAESLVKKHKFLKGFGMMVIDDNVVNKNLSSIKNLKQFKEFHQNLFTLKYFSQKKYDNLIYNDFDKFINQILDCVKEYEKTH